MKRAATRYIDAVILIGILLLPYCVYRYALQLTPLSGDALRTEWLQMGCLLVICSVCRSTPVYISTHHALDVSILAIITAVLLKGPYAATLTYVASSFLTFEFDMASGQHINIYNTPWRKGAFNNANLMISILLPGLCLRLIGHTPGDIGLPWVLMPMLLFTALSFLLNSGILLAMFALNGDIQPREALGIMRSVVPNVLAAMPLGLLTCFVFKQEGGYWVALITLLPLMLARYAWKLYLDAQKQQYQLIQAFATAMEARDQYTEGHSRRVSRYAAMIARHMLLRPSMVETITMAASLHDIGKIGVPDAILLKPGRLTAEEFKALKSHPSVGANIVRQVGFPRAVIDIIEHHHERVDGQGYPDELDINQLSIGSQILSVADAFDAMTSERPYRKAMRVAEAVEQLKKGRGTQFSAEVVDCMVALADSDEAREVRGE